MANSSTPVSTSGSGLSRSSGSQTSSSSGLDKTSKSMPMHTTNKLSNQKLVCTMCNKLSCVPQNYNPNVLFVCGRAHFVNCTSCGLETCTCRKPQILAITKGRGLCTHSVKNGNRYCNKCVDLSTTERRVCASRNCDKVYPNLKGDNFILCLDCETCMSIGVIIPIIKKSDSRHMTYWNQRL